MKKIFLALLINNAYCDDFCDQYSDKFLCERNVDEIDHCEDVARNGEVLDNSIFFDCINNFDKFELPNE